MKNISQFDFVIWNEKTKQPLDDYDTVYHFTTVMELLNNRELELKENEVLVSVKSLPISEQLKYDTEIELNK